LTPSIAAADADILFVAAAATAAPMESGTTTIHGKLSSNYQCTKRFDTGLPARWDCVVPVAAITSTGARSIFSITARRQ